MNMNFNPENVCVDDEGRGGEGRTCEMRELNESIKCQFNFNFSP